MNEKGRVVGLTATSRNGSGGFPPDLPAREEMRLDVPPAVGSLRTIRLVAADASERAGFDVDEIDDVRLAVDEVCHAIISRATGRLSLWFNAAGDALTVRGVAPVPAVETQAPELSALSRTILGAVCDGYRLVLEDGELRFWLMKRAAPA
jgi:histidine kinase-like protein